MPLDAKILGFSNTWYRPAMEHGEERELEKGLKIRLVAPVYFCASKLEAFAGRGKKDLQSHVRGFTLRDLYLRFTLTQCAYPRKR